MNGTGLAVPSPHERERPTEALAHVTTHGNIWHDQPMLDALCTSLDMILDDVAREHGATIGARRYDEPELEDDTALAIRQDFEDCDAADEGREPIILSKLVFRRAVGTLVFPS